MFTLLTTFLFSNCFCHWHAPRLQFCKVLHSRESNLNEIVPVKVMNYFFMFVFRFISDSGFCKYHEKVQLYFSQGRLVWCQYNVDAWVFCSVSRVSTGSDFLKSESLYFRHLASLVYHLSAPHAGLSARQVDMSRLAQLTEIVDVFLKTIFCFYCAVCIVNGLI